jgi:pre-mRNA-splicing factor SYF1
VYDRASTGVPAEERPKVYALWLKRVEEFGGVARTRAVHERAVDPVASGMGDADVLAACLRFAAAERSLGEVDRARAILGHAAQFSDPRRDQTLWQFWHEFEVAHGNEDTFRSMLRAKRTAAAQFATSKTAAREERIAASQGRRSEAARAGRKRTASEASGGKRTASEASAGGHGGRGGSEVGGGDEPPTPKGALERFKRARREG